MILGIILFFLVIGVIETVYDGHIRVSQHKQGKGSK
jgi:hypothetical protein